MSKEKIEEFLKEHHVLSLGTCDNEDFSVCSLFYSYIKEETSFIVASSTDTRHIKHVQKNNVIAGNILLETHSIAKIQGVQFSGVMHELKEKSIGLKYFKDFPYALALNPTLWQIKVKSFKMTDNRLGFSKKLIWP